MAKDKLHDTVAIALFRDGWSNIESLTLDYEGTALNIDIIADKLLAAQKGSLRIAVEVKSFSNTSVTYDFHQAVGQYLHYRMALRRLQIERLTYLAVPDVIYNEHLVQPFFQDSISLHQIKLLTVDLTEQEIIQWNPYPN